MRVSSSSSIWFSVGRLWVIDSLHSQSTWLCSCHGGQGGFTLQNSNYKIWNISNFLNYVNVKDSKYNLLTVSKKQDFSCNLIIQWPPQQKMAMEMVKTLMTVKILQNHVGYDWIEYGTLLGGDYPYQHQHQGEESSLRMLSDNGTLGPEWKTWWVFSNRDHAIVSRQVLPYES